MKLEPAQAESLRCTSRSSRESYVPSGDVAQRGSPRRVPTFYYIRDGKTCIPACGSPRTFRAGCNVILNTLQYIATTSRIFIATSLTKSATSRVFDSFFVPFAQTPALRSSAVSFGGRCAAILGLFFLSNPRDSVRVTASTRCCPPDISPIIPDHDDVFELPAMGEAGSPFT